MISFIIIGLNEGWKLELCFNSVQKTIKQNSYIKSEVIYVDSNSTDNSIEIAKKFSSIKIYKLTGDCNAAIARNLGASKATGDILFFIDGDMEIETDFLKNVINQNGKLCYEFIGGYYIGNYYNDYWEITYSRQFPPATRMKADFFEAFTGGLFIVSKEKWDLVGGMKNYMYGGEDPDFALRLADEGIYKLWINKLMAVHHTLKDIHNSSYTYFIKKRSLSGRILLYRENFFSKHGFRRMIRNEYMSLFLFITIILAGYDCLIFLFALGVYFFGLLMRTIRKYRQIIRIPLMIFKDIVFISGFFTYWPNKKLEITYEEIE